jgi:hypothetical protein
LDVNTWYRWKVKGHLINKTTNQNIQTRRSSTWSGIGKLQFCLLTNEANGRSEYSISSLNLCDTISWRVKMYKMQNLPVSAVLQIEILKQQGTHRLHFLWHEVECQTNALHAPETGTKLYIDYIASAVHTP